MWSRNFNVNILQVGLLAKTYYDLLSFLLPLSSFKSGSFKPGNGSKCCDIRQLCKQTCVISLVLSQILFQTWNNILRETLALVNICNILTCEEALHLAYRTSMVVFSCPLVQWGDLMSSSINKAEKSVYNLYSVGVT